MSAPGVAASPPAAHEKPVFFRPSGPSVPAPSPAHKNHFFAWPPPPPAPSVPAAALTPAPAPAPVAIRPGLVHGHLPDGAEVSPFRFDPDMFSAPPTVRTTSRGDGGATDGVADAADDSESPFQFNPGMLSSPASSARSSITSSSRAGGEESLPPLRSARLVHPLPPRPPTRYAHSSPPRRSDSDDLFPAPPPILSPGQQTFTDLTPGSFHHHHNHHVARVLASHRSGGGHARSYSTPFAPPPHHHLPRGPPASPLLARTVSAPVFPLPIPGPGVRRDVTPGFVHLRMAAQARPERKAAALELQRRLRRWEKLLALHQGCAAAHSSAMTWWIPSATVDVRNGEKELVPWVPDDAPEARVCAVCTEAFTLRRRRHHCRLCGRCVCGSNISQCSQLVRIHDATPAPPPFHGLVTRLCSTCRSSIRDHHVPSTPPDWVEGHTSLLLLEQKVTRLVTEYQDQLARVDHEGQHQDEARRTRSLVLLHCDMYQQLVQSLPSDGEQDTLRILQAIRLRASQFLEATTIPIRAEHLLQGDNAERDEQNAFLAVLSEQAVQVHALLLQAKEEMRTDDQDTLQLSLDELIYEMQRVQVALSES